MRMYDHLIFQKRTQHPQADTYNQSLSSSRQTNETELLAAEGTYLAGTEEDEPSRNRARRSKVLDGMLVTVIREEDDDEKKNL